MTRSKDKFHAFLKKKLRESEDKERQARTNMQNRNLKYAYLWQTATEQLLLMKVIHEYIRFQSEAKNGAGK